MCMYVSVARPMSCTLCNAGAFLAALAGLISQGSASEVEQSLPVSEQPSLSATGQTSEYWDRVQQFEPWVLRGEERPGTDHMRAHGLRDGPVIHYSS